MDLYQERENLRNQIRGFWKEGKTWTTSEYEVSNRLFQVHAEITEKELLDDTKPKERVVFSVCAWSERHGFFRSKILQTENLEEAKAELDQLKKQIYHAFPTIIVKETYFRKKSPAMADFDRKDVIDLGFSDRQEVITKSMCGNKQYRWKDLIKPQDDRFTY